MIQLALPCLSHRNPNKGHGLRPGPPTTTCTPVPAFWLEPSTPQVSMCGEPCLSFPRKLEVTLNISFNSIDFCVPSLSPLHELRPGHKTNFSLPLCLTYLWPLFSTLIHSIPIALHSAPRSVYLSLILTPDLWSLLSSCLPTLPFPHFTWFSDASQSEERHRAQL